MSEKENKNSQRERPLSPHISIYKPQITSVLSITHRATGVFLLIGAFVFLWELLAVAMGGQFFECYVKAMNTPLGYGFAFLWVTALFYHMFNGIRHMFWDMGKGLEISCARKSGWLVVILTLICSGATLCFMIKFWEVL